MKIAGKLRLQHRYGALQHLPASAIDGDHITLAQRLAPLIGAGRCSSHGSFAAALAETRQFPPVVVRLAERIAAVCPQAWVINFTNPAGIVTETMCQVLGHRVVGICDTPIGLVRRVGRALDLAQLLQPHPHHPLIQR